jgi:hypothetical protein
VVLTLETWPKSTQLTTAATVLAETGIGVGDTALVSRMIDEATAGIESLTGRVFARSQWKQKLHGTGTVKMRLARRPVLRIDALVVDGVAADETAIEIIDADGGWIRLEGGFTRSDRPTWEITYTAGFLLPGDDVTSSTISAAASDDSFNDTAGAFPSLLVAGDWIQAASFTAPADNGRHRVLAGSTASKILTSSSLVDEAAGAARSILLRNLPREIEREAIDWAKSLYDVRLAGSSAEIASEETPDYKVSYRSSSGSTESGDAAIARARERLAPWIISGGAFASSEVQRG